GPPGTNAAVPARSRRWHAHGAGNCSSGEAPLTLIVRFSACRRRRPREYRLVASPTEAEASGIGSSSNRRSATTSPIGVARPGRVFRHDGRPSAADARPCQETGEQVVVEFLPL